MNLGVHELAHAIHLNALKEKDANGVLFLDSFDALTKLLQSNTDLKDQLVQSEYFRDYAYTNQYEFLAVLIENFIETPEAFQQQFPEVYNYTKQMLNFNFADIDIWFFQDYSLVKITPVFSVEINYFILNTLMKSII